MKKIISILVILLAVTLSVVKSHSSGPAATARVFATGAPGEGTCSNCHTGGTYSGDVIIRELFQQAQVNGYIRGATHAIMVELLSPDSFINGGIQFVVLDTAGNQAGWLLPPNTPNSPIATRFSWFGRLYLEHDVPILPARIGTTNRVYMIATWFPSPFYEGPVTIYASVAACNGNGAITGDRGFQNQLTLYANRPLDAATDSTQLISDFVDNLPDRLSGTVGYQDGNLTLRVDIPESSMLEIDVCNATGQRIAQETLTTTKGHNSISFQLTSLSAGMYWVLIQDKEGKYPGSNLSFIVR